MVFTEAFLLSVLETTLGKWLFDIKISTKDNSKIQFGAALARSAEVYVKGAGFWIPIVFFVTAVRSMKILNSTSTTPWDENANTRVSTVPLNIGKVVGGIIVLMGFAFFVFIMNVAF